MRKDLLNKCAYAGLEDDDFDPYLYSPSNCPPPEKLVPIELKKHIDDFATALCSLFKKCRSPSNLLPHQWHCLEILCSSCDHVVCHTDKNLGPALLEHNRYLHFAFANHLLDCDTYRELTKAQAEQMMEESFSNFTSWLQKTKRKFLNPKSLTSNGPQMDVHSTWYNQSNQLPSALPVT